MSVWNSPKKGFTIIELLLVIALVPLIAGTSFALINLYQANDAFIRNQLQGQNEAEVIFSHIGSDIKAVQDIDQDITLLHNQNPPVFIIENPHEHNEQFQYQSQHGEVTRRELGGGGGVGTQEEVLATGVENLDVIEVQRENYTSIQVEVTFEDGPTRIRHFQPRGAL